MELAHTGWVIYSSWGLVRRPRRDRGECFAIQIGQAEPFTPLFGDRKLRWSLAGCLLALGNLQLKDESLTLGPAGFSTPPRTEQHRS